MQALISDLKIETNQIGWQGADSMPKDFISELRKCEVVGEDWGKVASGHDRAL